MVTGFAIPRVAAACMVLTLVACGGGDKNPAGTPPSVPQYAYVVSGQQQTVSQYSITAHGTLTPLSPATVATGPGAYSIAVDPSHHYVYVTTYGGTYSQYVIQRDGTLAPNSPATVTVTSYASNIGIGFDPSGQFAYVLTEGSYNFMTPSLVSQYSVGANGVLQASAVAPVAFFGVGLSSLTFTPDGKHAYVLSAGYSDQVASEDICQYSADPETGALSPLNPITAPVPGDPYIMAVDKTSSYAYVVSSNGVLQYSIEPDGQLALLSPGSVNTAANYIVIHPNNKYAYVANSSGAQPGTILRYDLEANGQLTATGEGAPAGEYPAWLAFDTSGQFLYAVNVGDNTISEYSVGADGSLTSLGVVSTGTSPQAIATTYVGQ